MESWKTYQAEPKAMQDRVILVTGAGQGIGAMAAVELAKLGATVILLGRNEKKLSRTYDAIESVGGAQPAAIPMDLAKVGETELTQLGVLIQKEFGRLDGILHCANGFNHLSPLSNQKLDEWVDMFRVNVAAPFAMTRALFPLLQAAPDAAVLVIGETHAFEPNAYWGGFSVTKSAQKNWIEIAASELDKFNHVRINLLVPGPIQSPFRLATHPAESKTTIPETSAIMPSILYWLGQASHGQSGQTLFFNKV